MTESERIALTGVLARLRPVGALEIGVYYGGSLSLAAQFAKHIVAIDINPEVRTRFDLPVNAELLIGHSRELVPQALALFQERGIPLQYVLIDAEHSTEGVKRDIELLLQYQPRTPMVMLIHDSANPECRAGIVSADWNVSPYVQLVECDFVPGQIIERTIRGGRGEVWGGLALAYFAPRPRTGPVVISQGSATTIRVAQVAAQDLSILAKASRAPANPKRSRVLVVSNFFPPHTVGGAEIVAFREARALTARGHEVVILAGAEPSEHAPAGTLDFETYEGLPVYRLSMRSLSPDLNFFWPAAARRLKAVMSSHDIEVVHFHNITGLGANLIPAVKAYGRRCIATIHDHWGFCYRNTLLRDGNAICANHDECASCLAQVAPEKGLALPIRVRRDYVAWCLHQADHLLFPSAYLASAYTRAGFPEGSLSVLSNGIDLDAVKPFPKSPDSEGRIRFLWSGYLGEHKGVKVLLDALTQLNQDQELKSKWHLTIAGEGHLRPTVEHELHARNLKNVKLCGRLPRAELLAIFARTEVSVLTSLWPENEPVTLLEAIASGTAQIATRIGGSVDLVEEGRSGFLVAPGDAVQLASAIRRYIVDPKLAAAHGRRNLERRDRFDELRTIDKLEVILTESPQQGPALARDPVVVCGCSSPPEQARVLLQRVHEFSPPALTPRFLWHEWLMDGVAWKDATLVWLWDGQPSESLVNLALRRGVPVLAPITDWTEGLSRHHSGVILYKTYLEALAALRSLLSVPTLVREFSRAAKGSAIAASVMAPRRAFALRSEAVI